ncbi:MAG: exopolyphosphatase [Planctomycetota bacterium]|nr:MAG: exopolyphosphatase [Planctomycetota bacterium]
MRLITRADFDGIVCGVLITFEESVDQILFVEPKSMQDKEVEVGPEDAIANLPYHPNCCLWFDHHITNQVSVSFRGKFDIAPSAARVVFEYYLNDSLKKYETLVTETDKIDSADLKVSDVLHPKGYVLLSFTIDPKNRVDEPYWIKLISLLRDKPFSLVMKDPEVARRCQQVLDDFTAYRTMLLKNSRQEKNVVISDFREGGFKGKENRFLVYSLFPGANVSVNVFKDVHRQGRTGISVGKNIFNNTSAVNVGKLLSHYGGGGHDGAGSCRVPDAEVEVVFDEIIQALKKDQSCKKS